MEPRKKMPKKMPTYWQPLQKLTTLISIADFKTIDPNVRTEDYKKMHRFAKENSYSNFQIGWWMTRYVTELQVLMNPWFPKIDPWLLFLPWQYIFEKFTLICLNSILFKPIVSIPLDNWRNLHFTLSGAMNVLLHINTTFWGFCRKFSVNEHTFFFPWGPKQGKLVDNIKRWTTSTHYHHHYWAKHRQTEGIQWTV